MRYNKRRTESNFSQSTFRKEAHIYRQSNSYISYIQYQTQNNSDRVHTSCKMSQVCTLSPSSQMSIRIGKGEYEKDSNNGEESV